MSIVAYFIYYRILRFDDRTYFVEEVLTGNVDISGKFKLAFIADKTFKFLFVASAFFYFLLINKRVNSHEEQILDYFSNTDEVSFNWFKIFRISFFFAFVSGVFYHSFDRSFHLKHPSALVVVFSLLAIFYWVVGYFGNKQIDIYKSKDKSDLIESKFLYMSDAEIDINEKKAMEIAMYIDAIIKNKKLYLKPDLTLVDLALITRTDRDSLSYIIKKYLKINFNNYINRKRIKYAKDILSLNEFVSRHGLYKKCGFRSKTAFNDEFVKYTGVTPSKYRNSVLLGTKV
jgi:AraC-like DNA-binding protein